MSFTFPPLHPPVIPQTVEQAQQRDQLAGVTPVPLDDPRAELERLRQAIREHREQTIDGVKHPTVSMAEANRKLWAHIGEGA